MSFMQLFLGSSSASQWAYVPNTHLWILSRSDVYHSLVCLLYGLLLLSQPSVDTRVTLEATVKMVEALWIRLCHSLYSERTRALSTSQDYPFQTLGG